MSDQTERRRLSIAAHERQIPPPPAPPSPQEIQVRLERLERRDWSLWAVAVFILLSLSLVVFSLAIPAVLMREQTLFQDRLEIGVRSLFGVVLLFNVFALYQQWFIKRLRRQLAQQIAVSAAFQTRSEVLEELAVRDELTGLFNRRHAMDQLPAEVSRSERHQYPLSVLLLDLDDFKEVNDRHGHHVGDRALQEFARWLRKAIRNSDIPVRMGGDEFMVVMPECTVAQLAQPVERMQGCCLEVEGQTLAIHFSVGWAIHEPGESPDALLNRADGALYEMKRSHQKANAPS